MNLRTEFVIEKKNGVRLNDGQPFPGGKRQPHSGKKKSDITYDEKFLLCCLCLFDSFVALSFNFFQMVVLLTSSVIFIGFDGMIKDIGELESFAFGISNSPGYGGGWSCCCNCIHIYKYKQKKCMILNG